MKRTIVIVAFFAILALACIGCLRIFGVLSTDASITMLLQSEGAILLLGGCLIVFSLLFKGGVK